MKGMRADLKDLKDNTNARLALVELGKVDKQEQDQFNREVTRQLKKLQEETIPNIKYRIAYWSGGIAILVALFEAYTRLHH